MSSSDLALPCMTIMAGSAPPASAMRSSPSPTTSNPSPSLARMLIIDEEGNDFVAKQTRLRAVALASPSTKARARARSACSSKMKAGVPNSAATSVSEQPPIRRSFPSMAATEGAGRDQAYAILPRR